MYRRISNYIGLKISDSLSSMEMFYIILAVVLFPLIIQRPNTVISWTSYISQAIFQAAALPLLGYVSKNEGKKNSQLIQETHDLVMQAFDDIKKQLDMEIAEAKQLEEIEKKIN